MPPPLQVVNSFQVGGRCLCRWGRSSYSIRIPSWKFVGLPILKIWLIFGHGIKQPDDLDLDLAHIEINVALCSNVVNIHCVHKNKPDFFDCNLQSCQQISLEFSSRCLTMWHKNYPLHPMYVCTLPFKSLICATARIMCPIIRKPKLH